MTTPPAFWRRLSIILGILLLVALVRLHLRTGYPQEWSRVQIGMTSSQVHAICGNPTHSSGMKPDMWEVPFLWGKWVLQVSSGDHTENGPNIVYGLTIFFDHDIAGMRIIIRSSFPQIVDYAAFIRAFDLDPDPGREYRVVRPLPPTH